MSKVRYSRFNGGGPRRTKLTAQCPQCGFNLWRTVRKGISWACRGTKRGTTEPCGYVRVGDQRWVDASRLPADQAAKIVAAGAVGTMSGGA